MQVRHVRERQGGDAWAIVAVGWPSAFAVVGTWRRGGDRCAAAIMMDPCAPRMVANLEGVGRETRELKAARVSYRMQDLEGKGFYGARLLHGE